jgi:hypothetical protein
MLNPKEFTDTFQQQQNTQAAITTNLSRAIVVRPPVAFSFMNRPVTERYLFGNLCLFGNRAGAFKIGRCFCIKNNRLIQKHFPRGDRAIHARTGEIFTSLTPNIIVRAPLAFK